MTKQPDIGTPRKRSAMADLQKRIHDCAVPKLADLVRDTLDAVDDALFDLAEKANSNAEQARYFDGMREVRRRRGDIEHRFQERLVQGIVDFSEGRAKRHNEARETPSGNASLSLVDNEDLEQSLAVTAMVSRAEGKLGRSLYALNRRLAEMMGAPTVDEETNPLAPAALASAFRAAIEPLECTLETRLVLFKLFDRLVVDALDPIYRELNDLLIAAGILPSIPASAPLSRSDPPPAVSAGGTSHAQNDSHPAAEPDPPASARLDSGTPGAAAPGPRPSRARPASQYPAPAHDWGTRDDPSSDEDGIDSPFADEIYRSIYTLMAARRTARTFAQLQTPSAANDDSSGRSRPDATGPRIVVDVADLLSALTLLQNQHDDEPQERSDSSRVKHRLMDQVGRLDSEGSRSQLGSRDEHCIDLVGMVFDFILQDQNLPAPIQVLLARLQIPYIKVALLDPRFFAMRSHPARRLLDELSQAGIGWSEASDPDRRLYERIGTVVDSVLRDFEDNLALFDRLLTHFRGFIAAERRRAEVAEQRAAEATRGRERLLGARRRAAREVLERVRGRDLPRIAHTILTRPWANFMVLTLLRQGEDSQAWQDALRFADDLVWASEPKDSADERERLLQLVPRMDRMLRHGLATVAYHDTDIQALSAELLFLLEAQVNPDAAPTERAVESDVELDLPGEPLVQALDSSADDAATSRADSLADVPLEEAWVQRARDLTVGTWVEFKHSEGPSERARLSWTSPVSGRQLFVNHKGLKVCDRSPEQLAADLSNGNATVIESSALVDRALADILERLRTQPVTG